MVEQVDLLSGTIKELFERTKLKRTPVTPVKEEQDRRQQLDNLEFLTDRVARLNSSQLARLNSTQQAQAKGLQQQTLQHIAFLQQVNDQQTNWQTNKLRDILRFYNSLPASVATPTLTPPATVQQQPLAINQQVQMKDEHTQCDNQQIPVKPSQVPIPVPAQPLTINWSPLDSLLESSRINKNYRITDYSIPQGYLSSDTHAYQNLNHSLYSITAQRQAIFSNDDVLTTITSKVNKKEKETSNIDKPKITPKVSTIKRAPATKKNTTIEPTKIASPIKILSRPPKPIQAPTKPAKSPLRPQSPTKASNFYNVKVSRAPVFLRRTTIIPSSIERLWEKAVEYRSSNDHVKDRQIKSTKEERNNTQTKNVEKIMDNEIKNVEKSTSPLRKSTVLEEDIFINRAMSTQTGEQGDKDEPEPMLTFDEGVQTSSVVVSPIKHNAYTEAHALKTKSIQCDLESSSLKDTSSDSDVLRFATQKTKKTEEFLFRTPNIEIPEPIIQETHNNLGEWVQNEVLMRLLHKRKQPEKPENPTSKFDDPEFFQTILNTIIHEFVDFESRLVCQGIRKETNLFESASKNIQTDEQEVEEQLPVVEEHIEAMIEQPVLVYEEKQEEQKEEIKSNKETSISLFESKTTTMTTASSHSSSFSSSNESSSHKLNLIMVEKTQDTTTSSHTSISISDGELIGADLFSQGQIMHRRITAREVLEGIGGGVSYNDPSSPHLSNNTKTVLLSKKEKGSSGSSSGSKSTTISSSIEISSFGEVSYAEILKNVSMGEFADESLLSKSDGEI